MLTVVGEPGVKLVEGHPDEPLLLRPADASRIIEACISANTDSLLQRIRDARRGGAMAGPQRSMSLEVIDRIAVPPNKG